MAKKPKRLRVVRIDADQLMAGDMLALREGRIRRFYHVCELHIRGREVEVVYNQVAGFGHVKFDADDRVRVREWY